MDKSLSSIVRENAVIIKPLEPPPLPPGWTVWKAAGREEPSPGADAARPAFRAVLLDVYGTLFCSAAGDNGADAAAGAEERRRFPQAAKP
jgi:hypothetical protein